MKKYVAGILFAVCFFLTSCTADTSDYVTELISSKWTVTLEGGAEVSLEFSQDTAMLKISNADNSTSISGSYIADEEAFVIFVPELAQNYKFGYCPRGNRLDLIYGKNTITLNKVAY